jgi:hypothetical protein
VRRSLATALTLAAALAGCGGGSHHDAVPAEQMLDAAAAHPIRSANVEIDSRLRLDGVPQLPGPIRLRLDGPYRSGGGDRLPSFDWHLGASALGFPVSGRLASTGANVYLTLYGNQYEVGEPTVAAANERLAAAGGLRLDVRSWLGRARVVGQDSAGNTDCERITAPLRAEAVQRDLAALGLDGATVSGRAVACVGFDDRTLHELQVRAVLGVPPEDRAALRGASSIAVDADVVLSDVGESKEISAPHGSFRPIGDLFLLLQDFAS